jgi:hypothetical protein
MYTYTKGAEMMKYSLITKTGRIMQFYVLEVAQLYQIFEGGVVITQQILEQETVDSLVK